MNKSAKVYFGFSDKSEFLKWEWTFLTNYLLGELIVSVATGKFKDVAKRNFEMIAAWGIYHHKELANKEY